MDGSISNGTHTMINNDNQWRTTLKCVLLSFFLYSCEPNDTREGVHKSKIWVNYFDLEIGFNKRYIHYVYLGNYIIKSKEDSLFLIDNSKLYVDTIKTNTPVCAIVFVNNIKSFPKALDDQDTGEIRKNTIFEINFNKDSLINKKYIISDYSLWKKGKPVKND